MKLSRSSRTQIHSKRDQKDNSQQAHFESSKHTCYQPGQCRLVAFVNFSLDIPLKLYYSTLSMTQDNNLVSPSTSACLKPGNPSDLRLFFGLRHSRTGDTRSSKTVLPSAYRRLSPHSALCTYHLALRFDTAASKALSLPTQKKCACLLCALVPLCEALFFHKYLIFSLFSATQTQNGSTPNPVVP